MEMNTWEAMQLTCHEENADGDPHDQTAHPSPQCWQWLWRQGPPEKPQVSSVLQRVALGGQVSFQIKPMPYDPVSRPGHWPAAVPLLQELGRPVTQWLLPSFPALPHEAGQLTRQLLSGISRVFLEKDQFWNFINCTQTWVTRIRNYENKNRKKTFFLFLSDSKDSWKMWEDVSPRARVWVSAAHS